MSEMSAEKKKEIEKYIIKSYFGGGKNVESLANGADVIKGTDDGYIPQLIVEVTYFGESGYIMINWNVYGDSRQNSFGMHICREREIERNRCDSVDAMSYAWESWRSKIQGKPIFLKTNDEDLQKDKSIEELEREVMERHIQELESQIKEWKENYNLILKKTGFDTMESLVHYLNDIIQCDTMMEVVASYIDDRDKAAESFEKEIKTYGRELKKWKDATGCTSPRQAIIRIRGLENAVRRTNRNMITELESNIDEWQTATGCDSPNEAKSKIDELTTQIEEWKEKTERCTPFLAGLRLNVLRDSYIRHNRLLFGEVRPEHMVCVGEKKKTIRQYLRDCDYKSAVDAINKLESEIDEWRKATGCLNPHYAKIKMDAYNDCIDIIKLEKKD